MIAELLPPLLPAGKVLDLGTGTGELAHRLKELGYDVEAADIDPSRCQYPDIAVRACDIMSGLPYADGTFDALVLAEVIEHLEDPFKGARELNRVLRPGGVLVLTTPNYGNIETRIHYLFTGCIPRPLEGRLETPRAGRAHHHISPMTFVRLRYLLMTNGFELACMRTCIPKRKSWLLFPVVALIWLTLRCLWSRARRQTYLVREQMKLILGGRSLITVSRKRKDATDTEDGLTSV